MKLLYFDCPSGLSCEMMAGALLDMGADVHFLAAELNKINFGCEFEISLSKTQKCGISASLFEIKNFDCVNKNVSAAFLLSAISESGLSPAVKKASVSALLILLSAIKNVSACENEEIFFPIKEGVRTVALICSVMILASSFGYDCIVFSPISEGSGFVRHKGSIYSIPEPVISEILVQGNIKVSFTDISRAMITDSGAAVCAVLSEGFCEIPPIYIKSVGYGAASFDLDDRAAVLRVISGQTQEKITKNANIDFDVEASGLFLDSFGYNINKNSHKKV